MKSTTPSLLVAAVFAASALAQGPLTTGNLVVVRVGTGAAALATTGQAVFLEEMTTSGAPVQTFAMPTAASGANGALVLGGLATSEGHLNLSPDARWLTLAGYNATPGSTAPSGTTSAATPRVIGRLGINGVLDTTTQITNAFSGGTMRSATTDDGLQFWASGSNSGVQYVTLGATSASTVSTGAPTNLRDVTIWNRQLYCSTASTTFQGVLTVGTGLPTSGATIANMPGIPTSGISAYDHFFADADTLYFSDDFNATGGIQKYRRIAGAWTFQYNLLAPGTLTRYLSGSVDEFGTVTLFAVTTQANANTVIRLVDAGANSPTTTIATAAANTVFRGIRLLRARGSVTFKGTGSPTTLAQIPGIDTTSLPTIGNAGFAITGTNFVPGLFGGLIITVGDLLPFGVQLPGAPIGCELWAPLPETIFAFVFADGLGSTTYGLGLPNDPFFVGVTVASQFLVLDPAFTDPLQLASSRGMQFTIGR